jgi:hypothetical protein
MFKVLLVLALIAYGGWQWWSTRAVVPGPGIVAIQAPLQVDLSGAAEFVHRGYQFRPLARFRVEARVLGVERYRVGREAELAPLDFALGWGPMSDDKILNRLSISQGNRYYYYSWKDQPPIPQTQIVAHSANMHMIPADSEVEQLLGRVRVGQVVKLSGNLVAIRATDGWQWQSSLSRHDTGNGACELVWVKEVQIQ